MKRHFNQTSNIVGRRRRRPLGLRLAAACVLLCLSLPLATVAQTEDDFRSLFDGNTLAGWRGFHEETVPAGWSVEDGAIRGDGSGPDLITTDQYRDFDLRFEWKLQSQGDSGVLYRVDEQAVRQTFESGIEYQLLDDASFEPNITPIHGTAAIYGLYGHSDKVLHAIGEYNSSRIVVRENRFEHWLNDELVATAVMGSPDWSKRLAASKFHDWPHFAIARQGHIALQAHGSVVWFRNLRISELTTSDDR